MSYQGKFSQPRNSGESLSVQEVLAQRTQTPRKAPAARQNTALQVPNAPTAQAESVQAAPAAVAEPVPQPARNNKKAAARADEGGRISLLSCLVSIVLILALLYGMNEAHLRLNNWLSDYEAAQPHGKSDEVFQEYFADPDWSRLYDLAGIEGNAFESKQAFLDAIREKVGDKELTYAETATSISGSHKYVVKLGNTRVGYFSLVNQAEDSALPDWQMGSISLNPISGGSIRIQVTRGNQVSVNGVTLDESYVVRSSVPAAEKFLPDGVSAPMLLLYQVDDLMFAPQVSVFDAEGNEITLDYDEHTRLYTELTEANTIGNAEERAATKAAEAYAKFLIGKAGDTELSKYYTENSEAYKTITNQTPLMEEASGYGFTGQYISEYSRYSDNIFSARVTMILTAAPEGGSTKDYPIDITLFFEKQGSNWLAYAITEEAVQELTSEVRITFRSGDAVLFTNFYEDSIDYLLAPVVTPPAGQVFTGWYEKVTTETGDVIYTLVFSPDEDGNIYFPEGNKLEPVTVYPLFEDADNGGA